MEAQTVSLWSVLLLAFRPLISFLEEKCHSRLSGQMLVNILRCKCSHAFNEDKKNEGCETSAIPYHSDFFALCHSFAFTIIRTASETFVLHNPEFLGKDLSMEH